MSPRSNNISVLSDRYELRDQLGAGGMAEVFLGKDRVLGRTVAVISLIAGAVVLVPCMFDESWRNQLVSMLPTQMRAYLAQHSGK